MVFWFTYLGEGSKIVHNISMSALVYLKICSFPLHIEIIEEGGHSDETRSYFLYFIPVLLIDISQ
jgi:hypothetical protein